VCEELGRDRFVVERQVRGCILLEFFRAASGDCRSKKHFKVWFNSLLFASTDAPGTLACCKCYAVKVLRLTS